MKKHYFLLILLLGLIACGDDNEQFNGIETGGDKQVKSGGDGQWDMLGSGFDITEEYLSTKSYRHAVLDINKIVENDPHMIDSIDTNESYSSFYYGSNASDYVKELTNKTVSNNKANNIANLELFKKITAFSANIDVHAEREKKYKYSSKYSFAHSEKVISTFQYKMLVFDPSELYPYLSDKFKKHLTSVPFDQIIDLYGTHVLLDFTIGGRLYSDFYSSYSEEYNYEKRFTQVKAGLNVSLLKIGLNTDNTVETTDIESLTTKNSVQSIRVRTVGGNKGIDVSFDMKDFTAPPLSTKDWESSVYALNKKEAGIVDINWKRTFPIYCFIEDPTMRAKMKAAVEKYIADRQIEVMDIGVPMYRYFNGKDHYYDTQKAANIGDWKYEGVTFYVYPSRVAGTTPLRRYFNGTDHYYEANETMSSISGFRHEAIVGYVSTKRLPGMLPVHRYWNKKDHYYEESEYPQDRGTWRYEGVAFYAYSSSN